MKHLVFHALPSEQDLWEELSVWLVWGSYGEIGSFQPGRVEFVLEAYGVTEGILL